MAALLDLESYLQDPWLRGRTGRPHLLRDPQAEREALSAYLAAQPAAWRALVEEHAKALAPLDAATRLFVFAIAGNEQDAIEACLAALADDLRSSALVEQSEILLVCNASGDETVPRARDWIERHAGTVRAALIELPGEHGSRTVLARSRKLAVDVALWRIAGGPPRRSCYFITEDADVEWIERGRGREVVTRFDREPALDALRGWHLRSLDLLEWPVLFLERASWRHAEHALSAPALRPERGGSYSFAWNRVVTAGWNVAFTLEAYVLAGGYSTEVELFEDMDLGQRISVMRGAPRDGRFVPCTQTAAWMGHEACSDGRRALAALVAGADIYDEQPTLQGFLDTSRRAREWQREAASSFCATAPCETSDLEAVWTRRRLELERIVPADVAAAIMHEARALLGQPADGFDLPGLRDRQAAFLRAARDVAAGRLRSLRAATALLRRSV